MGIVKSPPKSKPEKEYTFEPKLAQMVASGTTLSDTAKALNLSIGQAKRAYKRYAKQHGLPSALEVRAEISRQRGKTVDDLVQSGLSITEAGRQLGMSAYVARRLRYEFLYEMKYERHLKYQRAKL